MKKINNLSKIILIFFFTNSYCEISDTINDYQIRDVIEYLDGKIIKATKNINTVMSVIPSTDTILGIVNGGTGASNPVGARSNLGVPALDGTGAYGTWNINILGNAATATDNSKVLKTGDTMSGNLNMSGNLIQNATYYGYIGNTSGYNSDILSLFLNNQYNYILLFSSQPSNISGSYYNLTSSNSLNNIEYLSYTISSPQSLGFWHSNVLFDIGESILNNIKLEIYAERTSGDKEVFIFGEVYLRDSIGDLTYLGSTSSSTAISDLSKYEINFSTNLINVGGKYLFINLKSYYGSGTTTPYLKVYFGKQYPSNCKLNYVFSKSNIDTSNLVKYTGNTSTINVGGYDITNANNISASYFYGDGSNLINVAGDNLGNHTATQDLSMGDRNILFTQTSNHISSITANYPLYIDIAGNNSATFNQYGIGIKTDATGSYNLNVLGNINTSGNYLINGVAISTTGDNLGNHIATTELNLNNNNIKSVNKIGTGVRILSDGYGNNYSVSVTSPSQALEVYGNALIRDGSLLFSNNQIFTSSTSLSYTDSTTFDFSGTCGYNTSNWATNNNLYGKVFGTSGCSMIIGVYRYDTPIGVPSSNYVTGIKAIFERYADNPSVVKTAWCRLKYNGQYLGYNQCPNLFDWSTSTTTDIIGDETDTWGANLTPSIVNSTNTNGFGFEIKLEFTGNATAYFDYIAFQAFSSTSNFVKIINENDEKLTVYTSTQAKASFNSNGYAMEGYGDINITGDYYKNGVLIGSGGDNLGNHIATMTITANYGINASTIQTKNILVYEPSAQPYINILSLSYLNSPEIRFSTIATNSSWSIGNVNTWGDALVFKQKGSNEKMILTQDGKLSIGANPSPTEKLEVSGNVKADSFINTTQGTTNYIVVSTAIYALNGGGGGGSGGYTSFVIDDFSSQTNGSQTQFTLSQQPLLNSLQVSKNGLVLKSTADYSLSGQVITMVTAPSSNTALVAMYAIGVSTDEATIIQDGAPIGSFIAYSSTISPQGYLYCDGRWLNKNSYPDLFAVTGYRYSTFTITSGDWFQLPDLRGMFLRGDDTYNSKSLGYRVVGSTQTDTIQGHHHEYYNMSTNDNEIVAPFTHSGGGTGFATTEASTINIYKSPRVTEPRGDSGYGQVRVSTETRPINTAVAYHIKYANIGTATIKLSSSNVILTSNNVWTGDNTFIGNTNFNNAIFTFSSNTIFNSSITINANTSQQYALTIDTNNNTSDGYAINIDKNGILTYINQGYKLLQTYTFDSGTSYTFSGLSNNKKYKIITDLRIGTTAGKVYIRYDGYTGSNYYLALFWHNHLGNSAGLGGSTYSSIPITYANTKANSHIKISFEFSSFSWSDGYYRVWGQGETTHFRSDGYLEHNIFSGSLGLSYTDNSLSSITIFTDSNALYGKIYLLQEVYD